MSPADPDTEDVLLQHGGASARWIWRHLKRFDPRTSKGIPLSRIKAFAELSIAYACIDDLPCRELLLPGERLQQWRQSIAQVLESRDHRLGMRRPGDEAIQYAIPYVVLKRSGYLEPELEHSSRRLFGHEDLTSHELLPYRVLEMEYLRGLAGFPTEPLRCRESLLQRLPRLSVLGVSDAYSLAHAIFYLGDWGRKPIAFPGPMRAAIHRCLFGSLVHAWRLGNMDLAGELLISLYSLEQLPGAKIAPFLEAFLGVPTEGGAVAPSRQVPAEARASGARRITNEQFSLYYHTTLVSLILCCTVLRRKRG
jgi:hypothetical protein